MGGKIKYFLAAILSSALSGCIEQLDPDRLTFDDFLVVEALITDELIQQEVKLSRTQAINIDSIFTYETGATVWVENQAGERFDFSEGQDGKYLSVAPFAVSIDDELQLFINTRNGRSYESNVVSVQATSPIDSIYAEFSSEPMVTNLFAGRFNFFIDAKNNTIQNRYLRWSVNYTYQFSVRTPSRWLFIDNEFITRERGGANDSLQVEFCWRSENIDELNLEQLLVPEAGLEKLPIFNFHSEEGFMKKGFNIEIKMYALSEASYNFWNEINKTSQDQGSFADTQPGSIIGNMRSITNPAETVLGFFEAAQVRSVRRQFKREEFEDVGFRVIRTNLIECFGVDSLVSSNTVEAVDSTLTALGDDWVLAYFGTGAAFYFPRNCADCTVYGTNQKPDFWTE